MEPALEDTEAVPFPEPKLWPQWKPFTRGEYALSYDPSATPETTEVDTTPRDAPERDTGR